MSSGKLLLCWFALILFATFLIIKMLKKQPCASGSGIPQVRKVLSGQLDYDPLKVFMTKFSAGVLSMFCGYSLGTEGPTVQLGSTVGHFVAKRSREEGERRKFLISLDACSAMASAFDAPLASVVFLVEGLRYRPRLKQTVFLLLFTLVLSDLNGLIFKSNGSSFGFYGDPFQREGRFHLSCSFSHAGSSSDFDLCWPDPLEELES